MARTIEPMGPALELQRQATQVLKLAFQNREGSSERYNAFIGKAATLLRQADAVDPNPGPRSRRAQR